MRASPCGQVIEGIKIRIHVDKITLRLIAKPGCPTEMAAIRLWIFNAGFFVQFLLGLASAVSTLLFLTILVVTVIQRFLLREATRG